MSGDIIKYLEEPPRGWFILAVMPREDGKRAWAALMIDVPPDELKNCKCDFHVGWTLRARHRP